MSALVPTSDDVDNTDYLLKDSYPSCWITIGNISVYIRRVEEGVCTELYSLGCEDDDPISEAWVTFKEAQQEISVRDTGV